MMSLIVSLRLSFIQGTCMGHMLQCLYPLQQIIVHHFLVPLKDDKNLIIGAEAVKALFFCKYSIVFKNGVINIVDACP